MERERESEKLAGYMLGKGVVPAVELAEAGISRSTISRCVREGRLSRLARGIYSLPSHEITEWHDLAVACRAIPTARIALISALAFHEIGTQIPYETWIVLPTGAWTPSAIHSLRIARFAEPYYSAGVEVHDIEGVAVPVYGVAKTIADCFKMRSRVGYDVAVEALREGWRLRKFKIEDLDRFAKLNRVDKVMRPYIEAIIE